MAPRKPAGERPSTEERRARARAEKRIAMPSNRSKRPAVQKKPAARAASAGPSSQKKPTVASAGGSARKSSRSAAVSRARSVSQTPSRPSAAKRPTTHAASSPRTAPSAASSRARSSRFPSAETEKKRGRGPKLGLAALALLLAVIGGAWVIDGAVNGARIYAGVSVGEVDVSGMTEEEARRAVSAFYNPRVDEGRAFIFASDQARSTLDTDMALAEEDAQAEQLSIEEARANKQLWVAEAGTLGAEVPVSELVSQAFAVGREGGLPERLGASRDGCVVPVHVDLDEEALEALCASIDESVGDPRVDFGIAIEEGAVTVTEGHDGTAVDRQAVADQLSEGFLGPASADVQFVAHPEQASVRIGKERAEQVAATVQAALDRGCTFTFEQAEWSLDAAEIGPWVRTRIEGEGEQADLVPYLDEVEASADVLALIRNAGYTSAATVSFAADAGEIWVSATDGSRYPHTAAAVAELDEALFDASATGDTPPAIAVEWGAAPARVTFDKALEIGLIGQISSFTTEYNDSPSTANRRHNIHRAADLLNDSIVPANGGEWSFNATVGEASEESGFQAAHAIINGKYDDAIGGGICQVATTVFNAVYEAGYPVTERRNHSLYISSYPTGRDAAIAFPDLDLTWVNDGTSDVLVRSRYTDSTLTVTLYGIGPGYVVSTQTGDWEAGEPFKKRTKVDESEPEGTRYVKTAGADGRSVTVHRVVRDRAGNVLHEEDFASHYAPIDEVTVVGPNTPTANEEEKEKEEDRVLPTGD
ncbi:VanW family protein [Adlercreutzia shanghongiae]|uniref:VanW family protein n=1 Tax=Adlercreutzia shanghongiae TaxID=3111773 RepID=A0ABU6IXA8_9ACTN|nr:VanW family protein [Adlercreutzia sp. R22]MEC4294301.1 VanW family protein [Adlercreutzia sp. R22]